MKNQAADDHSLILNDPVCDWVTGIVCFKILEYLTLI
jgi:hypothetical protein